MITKTALIADIHGNLPALMALEQDLKARGITDIICMGDMAGKGPSGGAAIEWCRKNCRIVLLGNHEDYMIRGVYHYPQYLEEIGESRLEYLKTLPLSCKLWISGYRIHLFHGRPLCKLVGPIPTPQQIRQMFTAVQDDIEPNFVGYADIHRHTRCDFSAGEGKSLFNVGSVGSNYSENTCNYTVITGEMDKKERSAFSMEFISVPYDTKAAVENAKSCGWLPILDDYVYEIETGKYYLHRKEDNAE